MSASLIFIISIIFPEIWVTVLGQYHSLPLIPPPFCSPYVISMHLHTYLPLHDSVQPDFSNFHIKPTISTSHGETISGNLFPFLVFIRPCRGLFFIMRWIPPLLGSTEGNKIQKSGRTSDTRTEYTLLYPSIHWETQKILISCRFIVKSTFFSASQREWLKYISMSCWVSGFWSDSHFCINIQIHYHPREMNNRSYFISLTILNIMNRLTTIPHPSPWIQTTDRSPVGNGNVTLIHLFASQSLPNNFHYIASDPKMLFWKQARSDIHCRLDFTTV